MACLFHANWNVTAIQMNIIQNSELLCHIPQRPIIQGGITSSVLAPVKAIGKCGGVALETSTNFNAVFTGLQVDVIILCHAAMQKSSVGKRKGLRMRLQMREGSTIENPRSYANHAVEGLRELLARESHIQRDPNRDHFYQLEDDKNAYYIYVSPITGNVILLAKWERQPQDCYANEGSLVA